MVTTQCSTNREPQMGKANKRDVRLVGVSKTRPKKLMTETSLLPTINQFQICFDLLLKDPQQNL